MVRVVIVDDSALMRQILGNLLSSDPEIEVVGTAPDPLIARQVIKDTNPDVVTLDVEMPRMDGLSFLERIMRLRPMPVLMVSTLTQKGADVTLQALDLGAVDFIGKPTIDVERAWEELKSELVTKVKTAANARVRALGDRKPGGAARAVAGLGYHATDKIVAIGSSTGGVEALREVITALPADGPPILITQHMPATFTGRFAERLNDMSAMSIAEATDGVRVVRGHVYIAPGDRHLRLVRSGAQYHCRLSDEGPVTGHRPSVDVLFESVAVAVGSNAVGVILTGMGKDGAQGMLKMRQAGAMTIGQDEDSCLIYGMPKAAVAAEAVVEECSLGQIARKIIESCADTMSKTG